MTTERRELKDQFPVELRLSALTEHIGRFIASLESKSKETRGTYERALREFVHFFTLDKNVRFLVQDVQRYKDYLTNVRGLREISVSTYLTSLRRFCQYLLETGVLGANPAVEVKGGRRPYEYSRTFLTRDEIQLLVSSIETDNPVGKRDMAIIKTMLGCAVGELELMYMLIGDLRYLNGEWLLSVRGKGRTEKDSTLRVPKDALDAIRRYLASRGTASPGDAMFVSYSNRSSGQGMSIRALRESIDERLKASGVKKGRDKKLTAFSLRHSAGIQMVESGASVEDLMRFMRIEWKPTALQYFKMLSASKLEEQKREVDADMNQRAEERRKARQRSLQQSDKTTTGRPSAEKPRPAPTVSRKKKSDESQFSLF